MSHLTEKINSFMDKAQTALNMCDRGIQEDMHAVQAAFPENVREAHTMLEEERESYSEKDWSEAAEQYYTRLKRFELEGKGIALPAELFELGDAGTNVDYRKGLEVFQHTVIHALEGGEKGSKFPALHAYLDMRGDDVEPEEVIKINEEFLAVQKAFAEKGEALEIGIIRENSYARVRNFLKEHHASPHASWIDQQMPILVHYDPREGIDKIVDMGLEECGRAIKKDCGFGKYSL